MRMLADARTVPPADGSASGGVGGGGDGGGGGIVLTVTEEEVLESHGRAVPRGDTSASQDSVVICELTRTLWDLRHCSCHCRSDRLARTHACARRDETCAYYDVDGEVTGGPSAARPLVLRTRRGRGSSTDCLLEAAAKM